MSISVYHSNHLDYLQYIAGHIIQIDPLSSPFEKEYFLVQNFGMAKWMETEIAKQLGIVAQCEFLLPSKLIRRLMQIVLKGGSYSIRSLNKEELFWPLVIELQSLPNDEIYKPLHDYLESEEGEERSLQERLFALAEQIAALFDSYTVYRPDWINAWEAGEWVEGLPNHQAWQSALWRRMIERFNHPTHFGNVRPILEKALNNPDVKKELPKRIFIIGLTSLPPLFLDLLTLFSEWVDIHIFFNNPCQYYWGDVTKKGALPLLKRINYNSKESEENYYAPQMPESLEESERELWQDYYGHPLLASLGKVGRDHQRILANYEHNEIEAFQEPDGDTLLSFLKQEIFNLSPPPKPDEPRPFTLNEGDDSLKIHKHYSRSREVEGLYDQLLHLFNQNPELTPKDVVVMTPNIEAYAPLIDAIFGGAKRERAIPYSISDISVAEEEPVIALFLQLMGLSENQFLASDLLNMLQLPEVQERFNIPPESLDQINHWVKDVGIHFGADEHHISELNFRSEAKNSWLWGLKRLLLGYALHYDEQGVPAPYQQGDEKILPYKDIPALDALVLGELIHFIDRLNEWRLRLSEARSIEEWRPIVTELWYQFFSDTQENYRKLNQILSHWNPLIDEGVEAGFNEPIHLSQLAKLLSKRVIDEKPEQNFIEGKVTFCSFIPMRAIPFKVVCMIGMTQEAFPKTTLYADFNLMQHKPYAGDRILHQDDRYLFLEAILSAQEHLYLSYIGRSIENNQELLPSLLIDELLTYLEQIVDPQSLPNGSLKEAIIIEHPMAPYNRRLFTQESPFHSFQSEWLQRSEINFLTPPKKPVTIEPLPEELTLEALTHFYRSPAQFFAREQLGLTARWRVDENITDHEPFSIGSDHLERYQLQDAMAQHLIRHDAFKDGDIERLTNYAYHELRDFFDEQGLLPKFHYRDLHWQNEIICPLEVANALIERGYYEKMSPFTLPFQEISLTGELPLSTTGEIIHWSVGKMDYKRQMRLYLHHLINNLIQEEEKSAHLLTFDSKNQKVKAVTFKGISKEEAEKHLLTVLEGFQMGNALPITLPANFAPLTKGQKKREQAILKRYCEQQKISFEQLLKLEPAALDDLIHELHHHEPELHALLREDLERRLKQDDPYNRGGFNPIERRLFGEPTLKLSYLSLLFSTLYLLPHLELLK